MSSLPAIVQNIGLSDKAARVYLAALELGEASVQDLARRARLKRTTIYYTLEELERAGAVTKTRRNKKTFYLATNPSSVAKLARERLHEFEEALPTLENRMHSAYPRPRVYFLYGVPGFKQIWDKIFTQPAPFNILTAGESFLDFVKEKYILQEIISRKKSLDIHSRQLIVDSAYARKIVAKDRQENRTSKFLPPAHRLAFTEIICRDFVAYISPRYENMLLVVESESFAQTQRSLFEIVWASLPTAKEKAPGERQSGR